jgi:ceramide glucosyltransferase
MVVVAQVILGICTVLVIGSLGFYLACIVCIWNFFGPPIGRPRLFKQAERADGRGINPTMTTEEPVSILVPVCGLDAGAWENWSSLCEQTYSDYEVLFGVVNPLDPAVPVLYELAGQYPDRVRVFTGLAPRGVNHKDSTLSYLVEEMRHEVIIFADSDIRVPPDYIRTVATPLAAAPDLGMVTCAFIGRRPRFMGAALASLSRCCDFIPSALLAQFVDGGTRFAVGSTISTRRDTLATYGGLQYNRIGSDYNLGKRCAQAGYRIDFSRLVLESDTGRENIGAVFQRELRWARTIRFNRGPVYYGQLVCFGTVYCLPLLLLSGFAPWALGLSLVTWVMRYLQAWVAATSMSAPQLRRWFWLLPLRDGLSFGVWLLGGFGRSVYWRGRRLEIEGDGVVRELPSS